MKKQEGGKGPVMGMTKLILAPQQKQQLNLHLVQQMKLLQLGALELEQYVREAVEANPLLEFPGEAEGTAWQETAQEVYRRKRTRDQEDEPLPDPVANAGRQEKTLQQVVEEQLGCLRLSGVDRSLACYMAGTLDSRGWWTESVEETARAFGVTEDRVLQVLQQIQQMEPAGIGARDLSQCLLLQLENQGKEADLTRRIIREGLDLLARNQIPALARKFGCTQKEILAAKARICVLDPKPGARFAGAGPVVYQREDARVEDTGEGLKVTVYDTWGRKFVLNQEYLEWAGEQGEWAGESLSERTAGQGTAAPTAAEGTAADPAGGVPGPGEPSGTLFPAGARAPAAFETGRSGRRNRAGRFHGQPGSPAQGDRLPLGKFYCRKFSPGTGVFP